jgi:predicted ferric reductase
MTKKQEVSGMSWGEQLFNHENRFAGFTGILITWLMACMFLTAISHVRRKTFDFASPCSNISGLRDVIGWLALLIVAIVSFPMWVPYLIYRRCWLRKTNTKLTELGGFTVFWQCHKFWKPVFLLLLVHGPDCWIWFLWPLIMVACDRFLRVDTRARFVTLRSAELLKGKVTKLTLQLPEGWVYQAGMYVMINCNLVNDEEWHPFTLTSAPEQNILSVHIRCPDELDWCSALRRRLVEDPANGIKE